MRVSVKYDSVSLKDNTDCCTKKGRCPKFKKHYTQSNIRGPTGNNDKVGKQGGGVNV